MRFTVYPNDQDHFTRVLREQGVEDQVIVHALRITATIQRLSVAYLNRYLTPQEQGALTKAEARITEILAPYDILVRTDGDPRGHAVSLLVNEK